jgi:hypothetical protein
MNTLIITSPTNGIYEYTPTSSPDEKAVRGTLYALGCKVANKEATK